ncbi:hypothetical protein L0337_07325 [candidate division KSB1 bacterium]|nr:hypothetical protein [candidate division KSB1 bacterium]
MNFFTPGEPPGLRFTSEAVAGCLIDGIECGATTGVNEPAVPIKTFTLAQNGRVQARNEAPSPATRC